MKERGLETVNTAHWCFPLHPETSWQLQDTWLSHTIIIPICKLPNFHQVSGFQNAEARLDCLSTNKLAVNLLHLNKIKRSTHFSTIFWLLCTNIFPVWSSHKCVWGTHHALADLALFCLGIEQVKGEKDEKHHFSHPLIKFQHSCVFSNNTRGKKK